MNHPEENILLLYALDSRDIDTQRADIERHLAECTGCSQLLVEMKEYYTEVADTQSQFINTNALARNSQAVRVHPFVTTLPIPEPKRTVPARMYNFVRTYPIFSSASFAAFVAVALLLFFPKGDTKNINPSYVHYNGEGQLFEVFSKKNEKLWQLPSPSLKQEFIEYYQAKHMSYSQIVDLNGDGINEVVTTLPFSNENHQNKFTLKVFDAKQKIIWKNHYQPEFQYLDRQYTMDFQDGEVLVDDFDNSGKKEILTIGGHISRSPSFITHLDASGNVIGNYWHFGRFASMRLIDFDNTGIKKLIAYGINDVADTPQNRGEFPNIIILDPRKITGQVTSTCTPGFHFPLTTAEIYYIRLPKTDMNIAVNENSAASILEVGNKTLSFTSQTWFQENHFDFDFIFDFSMNILEVKSNNTTDRLRDEFIKQGKVQGLIDHTYLEDMKHRVQYWDGKEWHSEKVMVRQPK